jgi:cytochrome c oxidase assembly protein subunit 15
VSARIEPVSSRWLHRFAVLTAASTLFLIFVGGLVTSTGSALAVPDWPLAYGSFFPKMVGGVFYEHGHRMVAAGVGLLMTALACWIFARERRRWVGWLAACALGTVVLQGVLGGITVLFLLPTAVSVAHACLAQAFFCLTVTLAVVTGSSWMTMPASTPGPDDPALRRLTIALAGSVYLQLILGAVMRHTGAGLAIPDFPLAFGRLVPPLTSSLVAIHFAHRVWAACVTVIAFWTVWRVMSRHRGTVTLVRPALAAIALLLVQVSLGALTVWTSRAVLPTTAHVACGAAILAASLVLCLRAHRLRGMTASGLNPGRDVSGAAPRAGLPREATAP